MPLTQKGKKILAKLVEEYGEKEGKRILYAGKNSGRFTGIDTGEKVFDENVSFTEMVLFDEDQPRFKKTSDGYLVATPRVARTGIQLYAPAEVGKAGQFDRLVRIYRSEDEVFNETTVKSFAHRPVTLDHPPEMVDASNFRKYSRGNTTDPIIRDGEFIRVSVLLMDSEAIKAFESGKNQLSMGYTCDLEWEPGVTEDGMEFDGRQVRIRANHLALVANARGGEKLRIGDASGEESESSDESGFDFVHCPQCNILIPADDESCPHCGYEMQPGDILDHPTEESLYGDEAFLEDYFLEDYNENHGPDGKFASGPGGRSGGGGSKTRSKGSPVAVRKNELEALGYRFHQGFMPGGQGNKHGVTYPNELGSTGRVFNSGAEAAGHAEQHARSLGLLREPQPVHPQPAPPVEPTAAANSTTQVPWPPSPEHYAGYYNAAGTAAATGVKLPGSEAEGKRGVGRPRAKNPDGTYVNPRPGEAGHVARGKAASGLVGASGAAAASGFSPGRVVFGTHSEAKQHIRMQRRRWRRARVVPHGALYVPKRGFGFTRANIPGFRKQIRAPQFTLHHDEAFSRELPWTIVFDEALDFFPLLDSELTEIETLDFNQNQNGDGVDYYEIEDFNPWHDPLTGEFTASSGTSSGYSPAQTVQNLVGASKREAESRNFLTKEAAQEHQKQQLSVWKTHYVTQEEALKEIKKMIAKWEKAKVYTHTRVGPKPGFFKSAPKHQHYTVGVDSLDFLDDIQITEVDLLQAKEWELQRDL